MMPNWRVLIVDDDSVNRQMLRLLLQDEGFQVESACTLKEGAGAVQGVKFDVVIVDLYLPDGLGTQLIPVIRSAQPGALVTMFTGSTERPLDAGPDLSFRKGADPRELVTGLQARLSDLSSEK